MSKNVALLDDNNNVLEIYICNDDYELTEKEKLITNTAYVGGFYENKFFYPKKPFDSWLKDGKGDWNAPINKPLEGEWFWNEEIGNWVEAVAL